MGRVDAGAFGSFRVCGEAYSCGFVKFTDAPRATHPCPLADVRISDIFNFAVFMEKIVTSVSGNQ